MNMRTTKLFSLKEALDNVKAVLVLCYEAYTVNETLHRNRWGTMKNALDVQIDRLEKALAWLERRVA